MENGSNRQTFSHLTILVKLNGSKVNSNQPLMILVLSYTALCIYFSSGLKLEFLNFQHFSYLHLVRDNIKHIPVCDFYDIPG